MRRSLSILVTGALIAGSVAALPADAAKKKKPKKRSVTATYDSPAIGAREATGICSGANGCATFIPGPKERSVVLDIKDALGTPVSITVGQDTDPSTATVEVVARTCGGKTEAIPIQPSTTVTVWLWVAPGVNPPCPGVASSGSVKATFSTASA
jgi:hypothetical protein